MDDKVANEIIDFITKRTPMDHYCIIKKIKLEKQV
jgi:hypothetical protein